MENEDPFVNVFLQDYGAPNEPIKVEKFEQPQDLSSEKFQAT